MHILKKIFFSLTPLMVLSLVSTTVGELVLRSHYATAHAKLDLNLKMNGTSLCTKKSSNDILIYDYVASTRCGFNSQGYRDSEHERKTNHSNFRIVVIGDSVAHGSGVELNEKFPKQLETQLRNSNKNVEVITLARSGYSTSQELELLRTEAYTYNPDLILWSYILNDPADPVIDNANGELGRYFYKPKFFVFDFIVNKVKLSRIRLKTQECPKEFHAAIHCIYREEIKEHFDTIGRYQQEHKVPIIIVVIPVFEKTGWANYSLRDVHEQIHNMSTLNNLEYYDLLEKFSEYNSTELKLPGTKTWYDPWHPNAKGHEVIAAFLSAKLRPLIP